MSFLNYVWRIFGTWCLGYAICFAAAALYVGTVKAVKKTPVAKHWFHR
jgi:hypothetical protein